MKVVLKDTGSVVINLGDKYSSEGSLLLVPYRFAIKVLEKEPVKLVNDITWVKLNPTPRQYNRRLISSTEPFFHFVKSNNYYYDRDSFLNNPKERTRNKKASSNIGRGYFELIRKSLLSEYEKEIANKELEKVIREVKDNKIREFRMKIRGVHAPAFGGQEGGRKNQIEKQGFTIIRIFGNKLKRDIIECPVESIKESSHPAVYPKHIIKEFIKLLTNEGDTVLDPFLGSGTTAVAAKELGRNFIGMEISNEYCEIAKTRLGLTRRDAMQLTMKQ